MSSEATERQTQGTDRDENISFMTDEAMRECDLDAAKCTWKYMPLTMELIPNHRPIPRSKEMGMQNIQRKDSKRKGLNSLSPADSYKLNNEESNYLSGEKVSEEFSGVYSNGNPSQGKPGVGKTCSLLTFSFILLL